jgi:hypothetical protein
MSSTPSAPPPATGEDEPQDAPGRQPRRKGGGDVAATAQQEVQFGDLVLRFTSSFDFRYNDRDSGANLDGGFWHPIPTTGFHALGSIGMPNYNDPNGKVAALCVKASQPLIPGLLKPALKPPTDYEFIWNDKGSGARHDGSCWRPLAPEGYVALGDVFAKGYNKPALNDVMCVARELTFNGVVGGLIWDDRGSGANRDFSSYQIDPSRAYRESSEGLFAVNSFAGVGSYTKPLTSPVANTLRLPVPVVESGEAPLPQLTSKTQPPAHTVPVVDRIVTVPFTAVIDADKTIDWILQNSPFYTVQRSVYYDLLIYNNNGTATPQKNSRSIQTGVTKTQTETFSINVGITVSYESGVNAGVGSSKTSVQLSLQLGYQTSTAIAVMQSETQTAELTTLPQTAAALWLASNELQVFRADKTPVAPALGFNEGNTAYISQQYPPPAEGELGATYTRTRITNR